MTTKRFIEGKKGEGPSIQVGQAFFWCPRTSDHSATTWPPNPAATTVVEVFKTNLASDQMGVAKTKNHKTAGACCTLFMFNFHRYKVLGFLREVWHFYTFHWITLSSLLATSSYSSILISTWPLEPWKANTFYNHIVSFQTTWLGQWGNPMSLWVI